MFTVVTFLETVKNISLSKGKGKGLTHAKKSRPGLGETNHQIKLDSLDHVILSQKIKGLLFFKRKIMKLIWISLNTEMNLWCPVNTLITRIMFQEAALIGLTKRTINISRTF